MDRRVEAAGYSASSMRRRLVGRAEDSRREVTCTSLELRFRNEQQHRLAKLNPIAVGERRSLVRRWS